MVLKIEIISEILNIIHQIIVDLYSNYEVKFYIIPLYTSNNIFTNQDLEGNIENFPTQIQILHVSYVGSAKPNKRTKLEFPNSWQQNLSKEKNNF